VTLKNTLYLSRNSVLLRNLEKPMFLMNNKQDEGVGNENNWPGIYNILIFIAFAVVNFLLWVGVLYSFELIQLFYLPRFLKEMFRVLREKDKRVHGEYWMRRLVLDAWERME
jgi:hypothetical protein